MRYLSSYDTGKLLSVFIFSTPVKLLKEYLEITGFQLKTTNIENP